MAQVIIISRNPKPQREASYPRTWILNLQEGRWRKLAITRVGYEPRVKAKTGAA